MTGEPGAGERTWWPQDLRWGCVLVAGFMAAMALLGVWMAVEAGRSGDLAVYAVSLAMVVLSGGCAATYVRVAGLRYLRLSSRITPRRDESRGPGLEIPTSRYRWPIVVFFGAVAVLGLVLCAAAFARRGTSPDPLVPDNGFDALWLGAAGAMGLLVALAVVGFGDETVLTVHRGGVRRRTRVRKLFWGRTVDAFVPWEEIVEFVPDELVVGSTLEVRNPVIRIRTRTPRPLSERLPYDSDDETTVMAYFLVTEPNALMDLLRTLRDNPERRELLDSPQVCELLRPPPLGERFRVARRMRRGAKAARRNAPIRRDVVAPARRTDSHS
ncbi:hypothetical protein FK531_20325 [Rhodococcus spelaei]|uniref:Uncharacterized protein n=1 Tax=Rhodococcus spelaei TaxID=2546320 RepID=A0A541B0D9_9NOCA|nr:hypothetical protein [Rhodococcus spelaei]TQF65778.1 hypothetical protein FK531_20325 [Rhodococcus spelaei]